MLKIFKNNVLDKYITFTGVDYSTGFTGIRVNTKVFDVKRSTNLFHEKFIFNCYGSEIISFFDDYKIIDNLMELYRDGYFIAEIILPEGEEWNVS